jgi:hypothetical protein
MTNSCSASGGPAVTAQAGGGPAGSAAMGFTATDSVAGGSAAMGFTTTDSVATPLLSGGPPAGGSPGGRLAVSGAGRLSSACAACRAASSTAIFPEVRPGTRLVTRCGVVSGGGGGSRREMGGGGGGGASGAPPGGGEGGRKRRPGATWWWRSW